MESSDFLNRKISTEQVQIKIKNSIIIITYKNLCKCSYMNFSDVKIVNYMKHSLS